MPRSRVRTPPPEPHDLQVVGSNSKAAPLAGGAALALRLRAGALFADLTHMRRLGALVVALVVWGACEPPSTTTTTTTTPPKPTTTTTAAPTGACPTFPGNNPWNTDISGAPVHSRSAAWVSSIGTTTKLHPDFGTSWEGAPIGIPYVHVGAGQAKVPVTFDYDDESDPGPYPIPSNAPIEGGASSGGDRHVLVVDDAACRLYELYA